MAGRGSGRRSQLKTTSSSSSSPSSSGGSTDGATAQRKTALSRLRPRWKDEDDAWTLSDRRSVKQRLVDIIHRFYLDAISRLPPADLWGTSGLARGLLVGGHCFGPLDAVHNIIANSIWYAAAFPLRRPANTDGRDEVHAPLLSIDGIARICHRSVDGLVAALHHMCPSLTTGEALWKLLSAGANITATVALANGTSKSNALRDIASEGLAAFHIAAEAACHPNPAAFARFVSSELPAVDAQHNVVQLLLTNQVLATRHINYLSDVLVPSSPHEPSESLLLLSPKVLGRIASEKKQFQNIRKQVIRAVNMAMQEYTSQSDEHLALHSVCGVSLLKEDPKNLYHINFLAYHVDSGSAVGAPVIFFTEAIVLSCDEIDICLCVPLDLASDIGCCFACKISRKKVLHPLSDEYFGDLEFQEDEVHCGSDFLSPLDVDYIFFDADRDRALASYLDAEG